MELVQKILTESSRFGLSREHCKRAGKLHKTVSSLVQSQRLETGFGYESLNVHEILLAYLLQRSDSDLFYFRIEGLEGCPLLWNLNLNNNFIERRELG